MKKKISAFFTLLALLAVCLNAAGTPLDLNKYESILIYQNYTCHVNGHNEGRVVYDGREYEDGKIININLNKNLLSAKHIKGYTASVTVNGTDIIAAYEVMPSQT